MNAPLQIFDGAALVALIRDAVTEAVHDALLHTPAAAPLDDWLTPKEAAALLKCSWKRLETLRREGGGPPYTKDGRLVRYQRSALLAYQGGRRQRRHTSEPLVSVKK